ncbi:TetR/AcrR family transcriptional regulator [Mesorhizobium kowhaii]|uniref:TetR/AcrR family transcriptional regulator n=1 Tax=Mesorhizobium kowhaii TaxID=1300272 RepID=UPI0035E526B3
MVSAAPARKRDAVATREAILTAAREAFVAAGYDGAGVREIAAKAGVTAMMVNHYFGSKEQLFTDVLASTLANPVIITDDVLTSPVLARSLADALVAGSRSDTAPLDGFLILIKSAANPRAAEIAREQIERFHQRRSAEAIKDGLAAQRAAIALSLIAGFQLMRQMIGLHALVDAESDELAGILTPVFEMIIQAHISTSDPSDI